MCLNFFQQNEKSVKSTKMFEVNSGCIYILSSTCLYGVVVKVSFLQAEGHGFDTLINRVFLFFFHLVVPGTNLGCSLNSMPRSKRKTEND